MITKQRKNITNDIRIAKNTVIMTTTIDGGSKKMTKGMRLQVKPLHNEKFIQEL